MHFICFQRYNLLNMHSRPNAAGEKVLKTVELVLDVLKFLNYYEYCRVEETAAVFHSVIDRYRSELALCRFYQIQIIPEPSVSLTVYRRAIEITESFYDENNSADEFAAEGDDVENEEWWTMLLGQRLPLYAFPDVSFGSQIQYDQIDSFLLFLAKEDDEQQSKLCLELPLFAESVEELSLIRFWLLQLSRVHFRWMDFGRFFFNPDLVNALLSPSTIIARPSLRPSPFLLHCQHLSLKMGLPDEQQNERFLRFTLTFLVTDCLTLRCGTYFEGVLQLLLQGGHRIGSVVIPVGPVHSTVELQNLIIHHAANTLNPLAMVGVIEFRNVDDFPWPDLRSSKKIGSTVENDLTHSKYSLSNLHFASVNFTVTIGHLHGSSEFKRFCIQRNVGKTKKRFAI